MLSGEENIVVGVIFNFFVCYFGLIFILGNERLFVNVSDLEE